MRVGDRNTIANNVGAWNTIDSMRVGDQNIIVNIRVGWNIKANLCDGRNTIVNIHVGH